MNRIFFESDGELEIAAKQVKALSTTARNLLSECAEHTVLTRKTVSKAASTLEDLGFIRIIKRDLYLTDVEYDLRVTLWGEEALQAYEEGFTADSESQESREAAIA